ncbi:MAG: glycosyltransferase [Ignavibacterium sp.]|uniref:glycosyltransferase n=1 Tax=Ignavibacterium sp. TaxID=2651167 RepID=UPI00404B2A72
MNNKKIILLSDPTSSHTQKWANSLAIKGLEVYLFGLVTEVPNVYNSNVNLIVEKIPASVKSQSDGSLQKSIYLKVLPKIKSVIKKIKPNILHSHYASSYGLLGALSGFKPFIVSVWGNDVFDFPGKSVVHKQILKYVLRKADRIYSTSKIMANETNRYTNKKIRIIPFGVDTNIFKPFPVKKIFDEDTLVLGTVKSLSIKYGIEYLLEAFQLIKKKVPEKKIKLILVGDGTLKVSLQRKANDLNINDDVLFYGYVPHSKVPEIYNMIDIAVFPSIWESFGVSNLEAAACEVPQVASNIGGFAEIIEDGITGLLVEPKNPVAIAEKVTELIKNESLRKKIGKAARKKVIAEFDWNKNVDQMISEYEQIMKVRV